MKIKMTRDNYLFLLVLFVAYVIYFIRYHTVNHIIVGILTLTLILVLFISEGLKSYKLKSVLYFSGAFILIIGFIYYLLLLNNIQSSFRIDKPISYSMSILIPILIFIVITYRGYLFYKKR
jgi:hypothetical protein